MKLHQLQSLVAVVDAGSMRGAARALGITQPSLSGRIAELEQDVGALLLIRTASGATLTPAGSALITHARAICTEVGRAQEAVGRVTSGKAVTLRIGSSALATLELLGPVMDQFRKACPHVSIQVTEGLFQTSATALRHGMLDFVLAPVPLVRGDRKVFNVEELVTYPVYAVARKGHPLAHATKLAELSDAAWVVGSNTDERHAMVEEVFMAAGLAAPRIMVKADSIIQVHTLIASTDLIGLLPRALFTGLSGKPIEPLPIRDLLRPARLCLTTRVGAPLPDEALAFLGMIRNQARVIALALASERFPTRRDAGSERTAWA